MHASRLAAKVDNAAVQDGYQLYQLLDAVGRQPLLAMPRRHHVVEAEDVDPRYLEKILVRPYDRMPATYEALLGIEGVGAKTLRALALASELIYGTPASIRDPARFSFAHGGKDGHPFPVDRRTYEKTITVLRKALERGKIDRSEKIGALEAAGNDRADSNLERQSTRLLLIAYRISAPLVLNPIFLRMRAR